MDMNYIICEACGNSTHVDDMGRIGIADVCNDCIEAEHEAKAEMRHIRDTGTLEDNGTYSL